jgi:hypothetical protein
MLRRFAFAASLACALAGVASAQPTSKVDVTGTWTFSVNTGQGTGTPSVTFKQQGDSISGHYSSQTLGERDFKGTLKDGKITFSFVTTVQSTDLTVTYTGVLESSDAMKGTVDFGGYGGGTFTGARKKQQNNNTHE